MAKVAVMKETKDKDKKLRVGGKTLDKQRVLTFSVMLGAFLLAILMWFYVLGYDSPNFEKRFAGIDVSVSGAAELKEKNGFAVLSEFSFTVDVTVAGKKTDVNRLSSDDIRAYIDISSLTENGRVPVRIQVDLPNGIRLASLSTDTVYIYVDRSVTAEIELDVELTDYVLTNDLLLGQPSYAPKTVTVEGPEGEINAISRAYASVALGAVQSSVTAVAQVELYYENGEKVDNPYVNLIDRNVEVRVPAYKEKDVPLKVYFIGGMMSADNALIELSVETVRVRGTAESIDALHEIRIELDETALGKEGIKYERIVMPAGIENVSGETDVAVSFRFLDIATRTFAVPSTRFVLKNLPEGVDVTVLDETINVSFKGLVDALRYYTMDYFDVVVDFAGWQPDGSDEYYLPAEIVILRSTESVYVYGSYALHIRVDE